MAEPAETLNNAIGAVRFDQIRHILPKLTPLLERVVTPDSGETIESVLADLLRANTLLWVINDFQAITVTRIENLPSERRLWNEWIVNGPVGEMDDWVEDWLYVQEQYALSQGCHSIEFAGRIGYWRKYGSRYGDKFKAKRIIYRCELPRGENE